MGFDRIFDIIRKAQMRNPAFGKRLTEAEALGRWEDAVGPQISKHSRAIRVKDGILWVVVDHPIWKSELHYRKRQILEILNGKMMSKKPAPAGEEAKPVKATAAKSPAIEALTDILLLDPREMGS